MKTGRLSVPYFSSILACTIPVFVLFNIASLNPMAGIAWFSFMELLTPTLILGSALAIYSIHKGRVK